MILPILLLTLQAAAPQAAEPPKDAPLEWNQHLGAALRQAMEKRAQIVVLFSTKSCAWCRKLREETFRDPKVRALLAARVLVHLDLDDSPDVAEALGARAVPDVRLYTSDGLPLAQQTGYLPAGAFLQWLTEGASAEPREDAPSLRSLRLDSSLDFYFDLEAKGKPLTEEKLAPLLLLAAGRPGETRTEALRLVRKWAPQTAAALLHALGSRKLKVRLAAYDALAELGAPLAALDPWPGPLEETPELEAWLKALPIPAEGAKKPAAAAESAWTPALEADLLALETDAGPRGAAARERLISAGSDLVPRLRDRSRAIRGTSPAAAARIDELRFRILLTPAVLRRAPDAAARLAVGSAGARAQALQEILKHYPAGLEGLVREGVCDAEPLFREAATASVRSILGPDARDVLVGLLKDPEANVRTVALRELAGIPVKGTAEAIRDYLAGEKDPDMVGHAVRSLQEVPSATSKEVLRSLLESPHWAVRGAAIKALMEQKDVDSLPAIAGLLKDPDEFVTGQALGAIAKLAERLNSSADVDYLIDRIGELMDARPQLVRAAIKTLSSYKFRGNKKTDLILRRCARHEDGGIRAAAIDALANDSNRAAFEEVRAGLEDKDVRARAAAARALRSLVDTKTVLRFIHQSLSPDAYPECKKVLLSLLRDGDAEVRLESALAMMYFNDLAESKEVWESSLKSPDAAIRGRALTGLRWLGPKEKLRSTVIGLWDGASKEERAEILDALKHSERGVENFDLVVELLPKISEDEVRDWSEALIRGALGEDFYQDRPEVLARRQELARAIGEVLKRELPDRHRSLLQVLALSEGPSRTEEELHVLLRSSDPMLRRAALAKLLRGDAALAATDLDPLVRDAEPRIRSLALIACMPPEERNHFNDITQDWLGGRTIRWWYGSRSSSGRKLVQLPEALLNQRLEDADAEVRLRAAVLMTLEGSDDALAYLHRVWREDPTRSLRELLVRGVVGAWEDRYTSILEEVLETYGPDDQYTIRQMYQQIKPLKGSRIRAFRARLLKDYNAGQ
jgi:HEAT repeat protein/thioredoxin-related protein